MARSTDCTTYRLAASAEIDGEDSAGLLCARGLDPLETHLPECADCRTWAGQAMALTRRLRLAEAERVPDLTLAILEATATEPLPTAHRGRVARQRRLLRGVRIALVVVAAAQVALAVPSLFFGEFAMSSAVHIARETGAWNLALGVGLVAAAVTPRLASGLVTVFGAFLAVLVTVTLLDLGAGHVHLDRAASHLIAIVGLGLLVWLVRLTRTPQPSATAPVESGDFHRAAA